MNGELNYLETSIYCNDCRSGESHLKFQVAYLFLK